MRAINAILGFVDALNDHLGRILSYAVLLMFLLVLSEVIRRYIFNAPTVWGQELTQLTFGVYVILSGGHILRWGGHVNVDILYTKFSTRTKALVDIITSVLFFLFCGMLLIYGGSLALDSMSYWEHSISAWGPPLWPFKLMIPTAAVLLLLQGIAKLIRDIITLTTGVDASSQELVKKETA
ncbi:TRAP transporter small permease subunit [Desulfatitalea alkaliphila]|uniref:TRAP transporter small permease subunit n=1 Tax=Desulfatitalea alkaliphila TaxID=2929485 RepID=A0AA41R9I0_9BACT|nr:TRAP transporter small permease subunit [Desulfatitalea alkaliphila]MCJ8501233.1 TRAP transporter small permease subunit [Desulfatitalea alkaliphila]